MSCRHILFFFFSCAIYIAPQLAHGQLARHYKLSRMQNVLVNRIAQDGTVKGEQVTRIGYIPDQYLRFDSLKRISTTEDLVFLTNNFSPAVKIYAFQALLDNHNWRKAFEVFQTHARDTTAFFHLFGCVGGIHTVGYFMRVKLNSYFRDNKIILSPEAQATFDKFSLLRPYYEEEGRIVQREEARIMKRVDKLSD
jgi:hypothetical protein